MRILNDVENLLIEKRLATGDRDVAMAAVIRRLQNAADVIERNAWRVFAVEIETELAMQIACIGQVDIECHWPPPCSHRIRSVMDGCRRPALVQGTTKDLLTQRINVPETLMNLVHLPAGHPCVVSIIAALAPIVIGLLLPEIKFGSKVLMAQTCEVWTAT